MHPCTCFTFVAVEANCILPAMSRLTLVGAADEQQVYNRLCVMSYHPLQ